MSGTQQHKLCTQLHVCRRSSFKSFLATVRNTATPHHKPFLATRESCGPSSAYSGSNGVVSTDAANITVPAQVGSRCAAASAAESSALAGGAEPGLTCAHKTTLSVIAAKSSRWYTLTRFEPSHGRPEQGTGASHRSVNDVSGRSTPEHPDDLHCRTVSICGT